MFFNMLLIIVIFTDNIDKSKCSNLTVNKKMLYKKKVEGFIVGGNLSTISQFPHAMCLFQFGATDDAPHAFCGASVLNQRIILTAAHCVEGEEENYNMYAYGGHEDISKATMIRKIDRFFIHEKYDSETIQHDIALLFLDNDTIPLGGTSPIKRGIIRRQYPTYINDAKITGWGFVDDVAETPSTILKVVSQKVIPLDVCEVEYDWLPGMMCAGDMDSEDNRPARGDSGGGLVIRGYQIIGIVSFTVEAHPGLIMYTNMSDYYDWVVKTAHAKICET